MSEQENPALGAGADAIASPEVTSEPASEATAAPDTTEGQVENPPAEPESGPEETEEKSRSRERRERRKAYVDRLEQDGANARMRLERIKRAAESDAEPKPSDYDDPSDYSAAKAVWNHSQRMDARDLSEATNIASTAEAERERVLTEDFVDQSREASARYADYDRVVNNPRVTIAPHVARMIIESDRSADLAYAVASDPDRAAYISRLNPVAAARELGRIEASIQAPPPKRTSQTPPPIRPVTPSAPAAKSVEDMSFAEYRAQRMKELGK